MELAQPPGRALPARGRVDRDPRGRYNLSVTSHRVPSRLPLVSFAALLAAALLVGPLRPAHATVVLSLDVHQLVGRADRIFVGKVLSTRSYWTADRRHIVTDATVEVQQDVRGTRTGDRIVVRRLGGTVNGIGMRVAGTAVLRKDDHVLLFTQLRQGVRYTVGMQQGLFRVLQDVKSNQLKLSRPLDGLTLATRTPSGLQLEVPPAPLPQTLPVMIDQLRKVIRECTTTPARCSGDR